MIFRLCSLLCSPEYKHNIADESPDAIQCFYPISATVSSKILTLEARRYAPAAFLPFNHETRRLNHEPLPGVNHFSLNSFNFFVTEYRPIRVHGNSQPEARVAAARGAGASNPSRC